MVGGELQSPRQLCFSGRRIVAATLQQPRAVASHPHSWIQVLLFTRVQSSIDLTVRLRSVKDLSTPFVYVRSKAFKHCLFMFSHTPSSPVHYVFRLFCRGLLLIYLQRRDKTGGVERREHKGRERACCVKEEMMGVRTVNAKLVWVRPGLFSPKHCAKFPVSLLIKQSYYLIEEDNGTAPRKNDIRSTATRADSAKGCGQPGSWRRNV